MVEQTVEKGIPTIQGYIEISGKLTVLTGLHIGGGKDNSAIGVVDNTIIRDPLTREPIIPGSSLKGKIRTLLAKTYTTENTLKDHNEDPEKIIKLFGSSGYKGKTDKSIIVQSRLIFSDCRLDKESLEKLKNSNTDLYLSEVKFENTINRLTAVANPRQLERVPAGAIFDFKLTYIIERALNKNQIETNQIETDLKLIKQGLDLLEFDYLGGSGTRGSGRVKFSEVKGEVKPIGDNNDLSIKDTDVDNILGSPPAP